MRAHKTGYHVWQYGQCYWHRTLEGALRRASESWAAHVAQVIDCATGKILHGRPQ